jgi:hypothetical protein
VSILLSKTLKLTLHKRHCKSRFLPHYGRNSKRLLCVDREQVASQPPYIVRFLRPHCALWLLGLDADLELFIEDA